MILRKIIDTSTYRMSINIIVDGLEKLVKHSKKYDNRILLDLACQSKVKQ